VIVVTLGARPHIYTAKLHLRASLSPARELLEQVMSRMYPFLLSISALLSACDGGSNRVAPTQPPVAGNPPLVLSTTNAKPAVRLAYSSTMQSMETGNLVGASGIASTSSGGFQKPGTQQMMSELLTRALQADPLGPDTFDCAVSGTTTISGEVANVLFGLTPGDTINVDAVDCDDGLGEVVNGRMEMTVVTFTLDPILGTYLLVMDVQLVDLEIVTPIDTIVSNGDSRVIMDTNGSPLIVISISGLSMTIASTVSTEIVSDFLTAQTVDTMAAAGSEPYTLSASGTINSTQVSGEIEYTTPVTFQGAGAMYPFAGQLLVTGANNGTVRLIALDETNVRIETDTNGDGTLESSEVTTWDDIAL
jgi:hypothetical protein